MNGRQEVDAKVEQNIANIVGKSYSIIDDYYYYLGNKTSKTKKAYIQHVIKFLDFINYNNNPKTLNKIKPSIISRYMESIKYGSDNKEYSKSWRANVYFGISNFFDFLVEDEYVDRNVCKSVKPPKNNEEKEMATLTDEDVETIKENILNSKRKKWINRDMAIFLLGCGTGLRVSSISEINLEDINFEDKTITVTEKGNKTRVCYLPEKVVYIIRKWICDRSMLGVDTKALFVSQKKSRLSVSAIEDLIEKYAKNIGKHITPHTMRHTCGMNIYEESGDVYLAKEVLGHKNINSTMVYAKVSDKKRSYAAKILNGTL